MPAHCATCRRRLGESLEDGPAAAAGYRRGPLALYVCTTCNAIPASRARFWRLVEAARRARLTVRKPVTENP